MFRMQQQNVGTIAENVQQVLSFNIFICIRIAVIPGFNYFGVSLCYK